MNAGKTFAKAYNLKNVQKPLYMAQDHYFFEHPIYGEDVPMVLVFGSLVIEDTGCYDIETAGQAVEENWFGDLTGATTIKWRIIH